MIRDWIVDHVPRWLKRRIGLVSPSDVFGAFEVRIPDELLRDAPADPIAVAHERMRRALWVAPYPYVSTSVLTDPP